MNTVRLADVAPQPWRNGGGSTRELLAWPTAVAWQLRVSVASIDRDGDFSAYPGVDRWFAVVEGAGVSLALPAGPVSLHAGSDPLPFAGEAAPHCRLLGGATQDLNLMVERGKGRATMRRARPGTGLSGPARWRGLCAADPVELEVAGTSLKLAAGTLLWSDDRQPGPWLVPAEAAPARAWWLLLEAA